MNRNEPRSLSCRGLKNLRNKNKQTNEAETTDVNINPLRRIDEVLNDNTNTRVRYVGLTGSTT